MLFLLFLWRCLAPAYLVELFSPTISVQSSLSLHSAEQGLLHVPFARASIRPSRWLALDLEWLPFPRTLSQEYLFQIQMVLFGHAVVGSVSE